MKRFNLIIAFAFLTLVGCTTDSINSPELSTVDVVLLQDKVLIIETNGSDQTITEQSLQRSENLTWLLNWNHELVPKARLYIGFNTQPAYGHDFSCDGLQSVEIPINQDVTTYWKEIHIKGTYISLEQNQLDTRDTEIFLYCDSDLIDFYSDVSGTLEHYKRFTDL